MTSQKSCDKLPVCSADAGSDSPDQKCGIKKTLFDIRSIKEKESA